MEWGNAEVRGCGMVVDYLHDYWVYASLVALNHAPLSPPELQDLFESSRDVNAPIFGPYPVYRERVTKSLSALTSAGMVEAGPRCGRSRAYHVLPLGTEMLESLRAAGRFGLDHYEWLVTYARITRHADVDEPIPGPDSRDSPAMARERVVHRSTALLFGGLLAPKWTFATLVSLAGGSLRFVEIIKRVNDAVDANSDVVSGHLADPTLTKRLVALQELTLVDRVREYGRAHCYALTVRGHELVESLEPVAQFGIRRDAEMTAAVLTM